MRKMCFGAALALCALAGTAFGQATDDCASAPVVGDGTYTWSLVGATNSFAGSCGATTTAEDVFLQYVPTFTGTARALTCGLTSEDTVLSVHSDCAGTELACLDDFCGLQTQLDFAVTAGVPYYIRIASFAGGATGSGTIQLFDVNNPPPPPPPPPNDDCAGSIGVGEGSFPFTNINATTDGAWICGGGAEDVHFTYTPTVTGGVTISLCGSGYDTTLMLGTSCGGNDLGCIDDFCGLQSQLDVSATAGVPVHITIGGYFGANGNGTMNITPLPPPPPNDSCATPDMVGEGSFPFDNSGATMDGIFSCGFNEAGDMHWQYTPTFTGFAAIDTCGSALDTVLTVGTTCGSEDLGCNDQFCGNGSRLVVPVTAGTPVYVNVAGWNGGRGTGTLNIGMAPPPPANDSCATPDMVGEGSFPFDNTDALTATDGTFNCGFGVVGDLHWQYTPTFTGNAVIDTCGGALDTVLTVGTSCGAEDMGCNDQFCFDGSRLVVPVTAGTPVFINVGGWNGARGASTLTIAQAPPPPANDNCGSAEAAVDGSTYTFDTSSASLDGTGSCGASAASPDVWFDYVPSNTGCATLDLCGSGYDTVVEMFDACGGASLGCNDDFCGLQSTLSVNGVTAGTHYWVRVSGYNGAVGTGQITFSSAASTPYTPPGSGTVEPEPCDPFTPDVINAGCNSDPPSYGSISCGETILGTGFWNGSLRDTDWFNFSLAADDTVTFSGQMMFGGVAYGLQVVDCATGQINFWAIGGNTACSPDFSISAALPAGDYTLFIAPSFAAPLVNCGVNDQYWVTMSTGAGCGGNPCDVADTNCDGALNGFDVQATEEAVNGDFSNFCLPSADLNQDGAENGFDVEYSEALVNMC